MKITQKRHGLLFFTIAFMLIIMFLMTACEKDDGDDKSKPGDKVPEEEEWVFDGPVIKSNETGKYDGYNYELWTDSDAKGNMVLGDAGTFSCSWESTVSGKGNFLARSGKKFNPEKLHSAVGTISVEYKAKTYLPVGSGVSYLCVYGWTRADTSSGAPLVEYYIVDSWGTYNRPPGSWTNAVSKGTIEVDGGTYDIYQTERVNMPSIEDYKTFQQYWSVRKTRITSGTISVSEHFKKWESLGMKLGKLYEVALCVEGYNIKGSAEITKNTLSIE